MEVHIYTEREKIPAHAEMNVIRPKMQLSGGFAPVSLKREKRTLALTFTLKLQTYIKIKNFYTVWALYVGITCIM